METKYKSRHALLCIAQMKGKEVENGKDPADSNKS